MGVIKKLDSGQSTEETSAPAADSVVKPVDKQAKAEAGKQEYLKARKRVKTGIKVGIGVAIVLVLALVGGIASCSGKAASPAEAGKAKVSASASSLQGKHFEDVQTLLEKDGFTNIQLRPKGDLVAGVLHDEGDVDSVSIDGKTSFVSGDTFDANAKIVIAYHSYPDKASNVMGNTSKPASNTEASSAPTNKNASDSYDSKAFRDSMDSYESFIDSYVEFMKKYNADSSNATSMAADYAKMLAQFAKAEKDLAKIDEDKLTEEDQAYFIEVTSRCNAKLATIV